MSELHGLQSRITEFEASGTRIVAVSPDSNDESAEVVRRLGLSYPILSDPDLDLTRALGLVHEAGGPGGQDIPRPATFIVVDGRIVWRDLTDNWRVRPKPDEILEVIDGLSG